MIKGFIFDLDGVITDTAYYHYLAWKELGNKIGIEIDEEFNETLKGISRIESLERMLVFGNKENQFTQEEKLQLATEKNEDYKEDWCAQLEMKKQYPHPDSRLGYQQLQCFAVHTYECGQSRQQSSF